MSHSQDKSQRIRSKSDPQREQKEEEETALELTESDRLHLQQLFNQHESDGYIDWNAFCELCDEKNIREDTRNQYWSLLDGDPTNHESRLDIRNIQQIINKQNDDGDDEGHDEYKHIKLKKWRTSSDSMENVIELLMTNPLQLFRKYDMEQNGKLTLLQFQRMLLELYPNENQNAFKQEITSTFTKIIPSETMNDFEYIENVDNLKYRLQKFSQLPEKQEFLQIFVALFCATPVIDIYDQHNNDEHDDHDDIVEFQNIREHYVQNVENNNPKIVQMQKMTIEVLLRWCQEKGIVAIKQKQKFYEENQILRPENDNLKNKVNTLNQEIKIQERIIDELRLKEQHQESFIDQQQEEIMELKEKELIYVQEFQENEPKLAELQTKYQEIRKENKNLKKRQKEMERENHRLKEEIEHTQKQRDLKDYHYSLKTNRLEIELQQQHIRQIQIQQQISTLSPSRQSQRGTSHRGPITLNGSDPDDTSNNDDDDDDDNDDESDEESLTTTLYRKRSDSDTRIIPYPISRPQSTSWGHRQQSSTGVMSDNDQNMFITQLSENNLYDFTEQSRTGTNSELLGGGAAGITNDEIIKQLSLEINQISQEIKENTITSDQIEQIIMKHSENNIENKHLLQKLQKLENDYNQLVQQNQQLIQRNNDYEMDDAKWREIVDKLKNQINLLQINDEKWRKMVDKLNVKTEDALKALQQISAKIQEKEVIHKESSKKTLNLIKNEFGLIQKTFDKDIQIKDNEIQNLKQTLKQYENQQDILNYIQQHMIHKNEAALKQNDNLIDGNVLNQIQETLSNIQQAMNSKNEAAVNTNNNNSIDGNVLNQMQEKLSNIEQHMIHKNEAALKQNDKQIDSNALEQIQETLSNIQQVMISKNEAAIKTNNNLIDNNVLKQIQDKLSNIQQSINVSAKISADDADDQKQIVQSVKCDLENVNKTQFSSLKSNIHKLHQMINDNKLMLSRLTDYQQQQQHHLHQETEKKKEEEEEEVEKGELNNYDYNDYNNDEEDDDDDYDDGNNQDDDIELAESTQSSCSSERSEADEFFTKDIVEMIKESKEEIMRYVDEALNRSKHIDEYKEEEKQYENEMESIKKLINHQQSQQQEQDSNYKMSFLQINTKLQNISKSIYNNNDKMNSFESILFGINQISQSLQTLQSMQQSNQDNIDKNSDKQTKDIKDLNDLLVKSLNEIQSFQTKQHKDNTHINGKMDKISQNMQDMQQVHQQNDIKMNNLNDLALKSLNEIQSLQTNQHKDNTDINRNIDKMSQNMQNSLQQNEIKMNNLKDSLLDSLLKPLDQIQTNQHKNNTDINRKMDEISQNMQQNLKALLLKSLESIKQRQELNGKTLTNTLKSCRSSLDEIRKMKNFTDQIKNDIKNEIGNLKQEMSLDNTQNMNYLVHQFAKQYNEMQQQEQQQVVQQEFIDKVVDRLDNSMKIHLQNVDESHLNNLQKMWGELRRNVRKNHSESNKFWISQLDQYQIQIKDHMKQKMEQQMEQYHVVNSQHFDDLKQEINAITKIQKDIQQNDENVENEEKEEKKENDEEEEAMYGTSRDIPYFKQTFEEFEKKLDDKLESIKSVQSTQLTQTETPSYFKFGLSAGISSMLSVIVVVGVLLTAYWHRYAQ